MTIVAVMSWIRGDEAVTKEWGPLGYVQLENGERWLVEVEEDSVGPNKARDGSDIPVKVIRTLLLANGEVVYGCMDCFYVARRIESVVPHRNAHSTKERKPRKKRVSKTTRLPDAVTNNAMTVDDFEPLADDEVCGMAHPVGTPASAIMNGLPADDPLIELQDAPKGGDVTTAVWAVETLVKHAQECQAWKGRALAAEARVEQLEAGVRTLRNAMQGVMSA